MKPVLVLLLAAALIGCGGVTFRGALLPANAVTVSGFVTFVQFTAMSDGNGSLVNVTVVTLVQSGLPQTFAFCGNHDHVGTFLLSQNMQVSFVQATICGNIVTDVHQ